VTATAQNVSAKRRIPNWHWSARRENSRDLTIELPRKDAQTANDRSAPISAAVDLLRASGGVLRRERQRRLGGLPKVVMVAHYSVPKTPVRPMWSAR
jgi:hypothetical protein